MALAEFFRIFKPMPMCSGPPTKPKPKHKPKPNPNLKPKPTYVMLLKLGYLS